MTDDDQTPPSTGLSRRLLGLGAAAAGVASAGSLADRNVELLVRAPF